MISSNFKVFENIKIIDCGNGMYKADIPTVESYEFGNPPQTLEDIENIKKGIENDKSYKKNIEKKD